MPTRHTTKNPAPDLASLSNSALIEAAFNAPELSALERELIERIQAAIEELDRVEDALNAVLGVPHRPRGKVIDLRTRQALA